MEENFNKNKDLKNQQINFFKENKKKIFTILLFIFIISISFIFFNIQSKKIIHLLLKNIYKQVSFCL